ncbi:hypothetical protein B0H16DRAFT_1471567 [Mycena metata]|uniref:Uncharacterized protein n=1 Tax=Mycena metata TaxID=1033252 RepID=A0AAD7HQQ0_9AGAR|nr:hypothetical protein B0H16DRAFT_1471567 [Mycena metata]
MDQSLEILWNLATFLDIWPTLQPYAFKKEGLLAPFSSVGNGEYARLATLARVANGEVLPTPRWVGEYGLNTPSKTCPDSQAIANHDTGGVARDVYTMHSIEVGVRRRRIAEEDDGGREERENGASLPGAPLSMPGNTRRQELSEILENFHGIGKGRFSDGIDLQTGMQRIAFRWALQSGIGSARTSNQKARTSDSEEESENGDQKKVIRRLLRVLSFPTD